MGIKNIKTTTIENTNDIDDKINDLNKSILRSLLFAIVGLILYFISAIKQTNGTDALIMLWANIIITEVKMNRLQMLEDKSKTQEDKSII